MSKSYLYHEPWLLDLVCLTTVIKQGYYQIVARKEEML
jgi:hypothetical protein